MSSTVASEFESTFDNGDMDVYALKDSHTLTQYTSYSQFVWFRGPLGQTKIKTSFSKLPTTNTRISRHMLFTCVPKHQKQANNIDLFACTCRSVFCLYLVGTLIRISSWHESVRSQCVRNALCKTPTDTTGERLGKTHNCREVRKLGQDFFS